jgi:predicted ATPase
MDEAVGRHFEVLRRVIGEHGGEVVKSTGDGVFAAFARPVDGIHAAAQVQRELHTGAWPVEPFRVRMGLHTGPCIERDGDLYGRAVNKAARLEQAAYGGQVLVSEVTVALARDVLGDGLSFVHLGEHHFDGIVDPTEVHQLAIDGLPNDHPPLRTGDLGLERLPLELTPLIGRTEATTLIEEELRRSRVVTLVGPPGVGKSRMALRAASEEARTRRSGVRFVDLAPCRQAAAAEGTIANALGVRPDEEDHRTYTESIVWSLRNHDTLLVLDNCEHILSGVVPLVEALVSTCPHVTVLATSRERLGLPYEVAWPVHTLALPDADVATVGDIEKVASVQLLVDRARAIRADFALSDADVPAVAAICRRCDGLPLALELAAARLETLSPAELLAALEGPQGLLGYDLGGGLRDALDASYAALGDDERRVLDELAVFAGPATADAIAAVCTPPGTDVRRCLDGLVKHSLCFVDRPSTWTRFGLLESVRQYAASHGRVDAALQARHAAHFLEEAERRGRQYRTAEGHEATRALVEELDDLRLAVQWLTAVERVVDAARIVLALHEFCLFTLRPELHTWAVDLDGRLPAHDPRAAELKGVIAIGSWFRGNHEAALAVAQDALDAAAVADGPASTIWARTALLNASGSIGDLDAATGHLRALHDECVATGDPFWHVNALATEAVGLASVGLSELAQQPAARAVRLAEDLGNPECRYWSAYAEAVALRPTDLDAAEAALDRALLAARSNGARFNEGIVLTEQLGVLLERGRVQEAAVTALDLLHHGERTGGFGRVWQAVVLASRALLDGGRPEAAALVYLAAMARPVVPQAQMVLVTTALEADLHGALGDATMGQLGQRARFLTDAQVLQRCREELELLLRA